MKRDLDEAVDELMDAVPDGEARVRLQAALDLSLGMNPLTPDHHFYIDQGTNARLRLVLVAIGRALVQEGRSTTPRTSCSSATTSCASSWPTGTRSRPRRSCPSAATRATPPSPSARREWLGTATEAALDFPYLTLWGFPEKFHREPPHDADRAARARRVARRGRGDGAHRRDPGRFDKVQNGEILVCQMTNPAWVVLFTKIAGLVTDAGGVASHPAVVAREFGIPAVVGTSTATQRIKTGDRVRVNGATGRRVCA